MKEKLQPKPTIIVPDAYSYMGATEGQKVRPVPVVKKDEVIPADRPQKSNKLGLA